MSPAGSMESISPASCPNKSAPTVHVTSQPGLLQTGRDQAPLSPQITLAADPALHEFVAVGARPDCPGGQVGDLRGQCVMTVTGHNRLLVRVGQRRLGSGQEASSH
jgi:hypothetical protein